MYVCVCVSVERAGKSAVGHRWVTQHSQAGFWDCDMRLNELWPQRDPFNQSSHASPPLLNPTWTWLPNPANSNESQETASVIPLPQERKTPPQYSLAESERNSLISP